MPSETAELARYERLVLEAISSMSLDLDGLTVSREGGTGAYRITVPIAARRSESAVASLQFDSGIIAQLTASHVTNGKVRTLAITARDAYVTLDYQDQRLTIHSHGLYDDALV